MQIITEKVRVLTQPAYEELQYAIHAMKSRFPEAKSDLEWLNWRFAGVSEADTRAVAS